MEIEAVNEMKPAKTGKELMLERLSVKHPDINGDDEESLVTYSERCTKIFFFIFACDCINISLHILVIFIMLPLHIR